VTERIGPQAAGQTSYIGTVVATDEATLGFPLGGTILDRPVEAGDVVVSGQTLARLNPSDLEAGLRSAEAGVLVAETQLRAAQDAQTRVDELTARGVAAATRLEDAERALVAALSRREQAGANLTQAQDMLDFAELRAPQNGVVLEVFAEPGATVSAGQTVLTLANTDQREVVMDVGEHQLAAWTQGLVFSVSLMANPDITASAILTRIDPVASSDTRTRQLHLTVDQPPSGFRFGSLVQLRTASGVVPGVSVPLSAVLNPDGDAAVWLVDRKSNTVRRQTIVLAATFGTRVRVTEGLADGDEIILKGVHSLTDGQTIGRSISQ
jgi:RND family efflux transporter MFP subunit